MRCDLSRAAALVALWSLAGVAWSAEARAEEPARPSVQIAETCTIDAVPAPGGGGFRGNLRRREKPPDYLLPKKEEQQPQSQSAPADPAVVGVPSETAVRLTELKGVFEKGLITEAEYEASQARILTDITPASNGVETGLRILRQLWEQELITPSPYADKRKEMLDAL